MVGEPGNDTYVVDSTAATVVENANEGTDNVSSSITYTLGTNVENLTLTGTNAINGTGNDLNNLLLGNTAANLLNGGLGDYTLYGGQGNDTLNGLTGNDALYGGLGDDNYVVDSTGDSVAESADQGTDKVRATITYTLGDNLENLQLTANTHINGTGNSLNNNITGANGNNALYGLDGDDTLFGGSGNDTLVGGVGNDSMVGGAHDDTYVVDSTNDIVVEDASAGDDTVQVSFSYTLTDNVEDLVLTGTDNLTGTGNARYNRLIGTNGNNALYGADD